MAKVLLIATGDTIAYGRRGAAPAVLTGAELLATLPPGAHRGATIVTEDVRVEPSWDMSPATMLMLARRVRSAILDDGYEGVVVSHGVDTVEETAFLTDLLAGPATARAGLVFTGALRRPTTRTRTARATSRRRSPRRATPPCAWPAPWCAPATTCTPPAG